MKILERLWRDEAGFVATTDLVLIAVILVMGSIVGLVTLRDQVVQEFGDLATAIGRLNQSYSYEGDSFGCDGGGSGQHAQIGGPRPPRCECFVAGSSYHDRTDFCEEEDRAGRAPAGIKINDPPRKEGHSH